MRNSILRPSVFSRLVLSGLGLIMIMGLQACGQTGTLALPSSPKYDKRPYYLMYKDNRKTEHAASEAHSTAPSQAQN